MTWLLLLVRAPFVRLFALAAFVCLALLQIAAAPPSNVPSISSVLPALAIIAASSIGSFVVAVILDDVAGVALAIKQKTFDANKLPTFLESEFGTRQAAALAGLVVTAVSAAAGTAILKGGLNQQALQAIADAAFAAATAGAAAMLVSVVKDLFAKVGQLFGVEPPPIMVASSPPK